MANWASGDRCFCGTALRPRARYYCSDPCSRSADRAKRYGLAPGSVERLWQLQAGLCAICGVYLDVELWKATVVDHDHVTGQARGLLCRPCNSALRFVDAALRGGAQPTATGRGGRFAERIRGYMACPPAVRTTRVEEAGGDWTEAA